MKNHRSAACKSVLGARAGASLLLVTLLFAGCAVIPPPAAQEAAEAVNAVETSRAIANAADIGLPAGGSTAASSAKPWQWHSAPVSVSQIPDGEDGKAAIAIAQPPPLFTLEQAAAEATAAADRADQALIAEGSPAGGPSIRFKKPFGEPAVAADGEEVDRGTASWYGLQFHGRRTANGERYDMYDLTAAHKTLPFNTIVSVHNLQTGRSVRVRINDRGPYVDGRVIDLSKAAAEQLGMAEVGLRPVSLVVEEWPAEGTGGHDTKRRASRSKKKSRPAEPVEVP